MKNNNIISFQADDFTKQLLDEMMMEGDTFENTNRSKIIRNSIRTYYNYLNYQKKTSMGEK